MNKKIYLIQEGMMHKAFYKILKKIKSIAQNEGQYLINEKNFQKIIKILKKDYCLRKDFKWENKDEEFNELSNLGIEIFEYIKTKK
jgi:hypothetical protein